MKLVNEFDHPDHGWKWRECEVHWINERIKSAVDEERKACAKLCEDLPTPDGLRNATTYEAATMDCAEAILMRSNGQR